MCTDTPQRYLRRILVSDFKQTKRWPIIPSLRRCQCSPPPAYLSMCTDTPQRYLRRILILDFKQKNAGRPFSFQNRFSLLWQPCSLQKVSCSLAVKFVDLFNDSMEVVSARIVHGTVSSRSVETTKRYIRTGFSKTHRGLRK